MTESDTRALITLENTRSNLQTDFFRVEGLRLLNYELLTEEADCNITNSRLNDYGDALPKNTGKSGANISSQRMDDLDDMCIKYAQELNVSKRKQYKALDLGCGDAIMGLNLSLAGYKVLLYDEAPIPKMLYEIRDSYSRVSLKFRNIDLSKTKKSDFPINGVDIIYSQRFLHYLKYREAKQLLIHACRGITSGGHLFISVSGINSEIGLAHPQREKPVQTRFAKIRQDIADKHSIQKPICVYSKEELVTLIESIGFMKIHIWESGFGNIKGVFSFKTTKDRSDRVSTR